MLAPSFSQLTILGLTATLLSFGSTVTALGINCRGSGNCGLRTESIRDNAASQLVRVIRTIPNDRWYNNGQKIACDGDICAFLQNTGGAWSQKIKELAPYITGHNCRVCGSVPYYYPGSNDVAEGQLTFNYVTSSCARPWETKLC